MGYATETWSLLQHELASQYSNTTLSTWFDEIQAVDVTDNRLILCCTNAFKRSMIESHFHDGMKAALGNLFSSSDFDVEILSSAENYGHQKVTPSLLISEYSDFTFDTFVVGRSNELAYSTAHTVSEALGTVHNPLLIYGDSGLGKTHLMKAIADSVRKKDSSIHIVDTSGNALTNELVSAIRHKDTDALREKYQGASLLLVDDIQFIAGKVQTQEEFFNTFNSLISSGCQIVLTSDRPPKDMNQLDHRLRTRFEGGMMADITRPDYETRLAIVNSLSSRCHIKMDEQTAEYIAEAITDNVRQIKGVINKLKAMQDLSRYPLSMIEVAKTVNDFLPRQAEIVTIDDIVAEVSRFYGIDPKMITGKARTRAISNARNVCIFLAHSMLGLSSLDLGVYFNRDHSTVLYALKKAAMAANNDSDFSRQIENFKACISARRTESRH